MLLIDLPFVRAMAFFPRPAFPDTAATSRTFDGKIPVEPGIDLGYRFYNHRKSATILCFHGNGEIATDYDELAHYYRRHVGASLLVVDYRGYGWSTGKPTFRTLLSDTEAIYEALPDIWSRAGLGGPPALYVMGRSLGSAPAIHLVCTHQGAFCGLIIESGFATLFSALQHLAG